MMHDQPFRFLQAADLRLDAPLGGVAQVPEHLQSLILDATYRAAERVFATAVSERVSCLTLSGDMLGHAEPSARALAFLRDQLAELGAAGIAVFWAPALDGAAWPESVTLPDNVVLFDSGIQQHTLSFGDQESVTLLGHCTRRGELARAAAFEASGHGRYTVGVLSGGLDTIGVAEANVDYWALGGHGARATFSEGSPIRHDPGPPQGRTPADVGPHGCTLVEVGAGRETRMRLVVCDTVRWHEERVSLSLEQTWEAWQNRLADRVKNLQALMPEQPVLVRWLVELTGEVTGGEPVRDRLGRLTDWLRRQFGSGPSPCWTVEIEVERTMVDIAEWAEEDTLLGDYVRAMQAAWQDDPAIVARLAPADPRIRAVLEEQLRLSDPQQQQQVLQRAAELGAQLLRGDELA